MAIPTQRQRWHRDLLVFAFLAEWSDPGQGMAKVGYAILVLLAGTSMVSGEARAVVFATGMHTEFGKIAHLAQTAAKAPLRCATRSRT